mmetsp:Transcript_50955/g.119451  ORF Transcript_50955/g.119451 Transcript_50955/m.119451 type:complete len:308 (+) Transcript_50955:1544-2467(+)
MPGCAVHRQRIAAQHAFELKAAALGHGPAARVLGVTADLDPPRVQRPECQHGQQPHRFADEALASRLGPDPVADLELAHRPVDAVQAGAAQQPARVAVGLAGIDMEAQVSAGDEVGRHAPHHQFRALGAGRLLSPGHPGPQMRQRLRDDDRQLRPEAGAGRLQHDAFAVQALGNIDQQGVQAHAVATSTGWGSSRTPRITSCRQAHSASRQAPAPAKPSAARSPTCSPSQPPISAPGPAGSRISQRIVLVMRPSIGAGVTACRSDRKLMKISTAPTPNANNIRPKLITPPGPAGASASWPQPRPQAA